MFKSLKNFIFAIIMALALLIFGSIYLFTNYLHATLSKQEAEKTSDAIASQVFSSMYQVMSKGWSRQEMQTFLNSTEKAFEDSTNQITIYRSENVASLFGEIEQKSLSEAVKEAFKNGEKRVIQKGELVTTLMPLKANKNCLACHVNAQQDTVLGVIEVSRDLTEVTHETESSYARFYLIALPFVIVLAFLLSRFITRQLEASMHSFNEKVTSINSVKDFRELNIEDIDLGFTEFNRILCNVNKLTERLKAVAVDKDLLEFEIRLLDKFIITSDVVKDWKEYIKDLLSEINTVMDAHSLFTMFRMGDDSYEIEIFWKYDPVPENRQLMEEIIHQEIKDSPHFDSSMHYYINHNISNPDQSLPPLTRDEIEMQSKSLFLDSPKIGGIVGIGVQTMIVRDPIRYIVIEGILTTLINLVGSIKAIHKYTHDLEYYATRDPLTALFNQRVFRDLLDYEVKRAEHHDHSFGVLVIDCDNFKPINDRYGHSFGDEFLREFANMLEEVKRAEDIAARYGGDEFSLILPESDAQEVYQIAERILKATESFEMATPDGAIAHTTISIGIAMYPDHATKPGDLFNIADGMMYRSKRKGKNSVSFPDRDDIAKVFKETQDKTVLVLDAMKHDKIVPHFQPITDLSTSKVHIHELLMRIELDDDTISASAFIEVAESMGIVHKMDYIVIEKAFKVINESGYDGLLFINLSPRSLIISEFIDKIVELVHQYDIEKSHIVFEITERETVKSFALLEKFVKNLKMEGFSFAIDDFGSGFSTFHYIKKFPIDYIKIDGEFILNINKDRKDKAFVKSIVALAQQLDVKTIAEFVEDEETLKHLQSIGVDFAQGYFLGTPSEQIKNHNG